MTNLEEYASYGWLITKDHLSDDENGVRSTSEVDTIGPRNIDPIIESDLLSGKGHPFKMYDDDDILYFEGLTLAKDDDMVFEEASYGPLRDFGQPGFGCTYIKYPGHKEWDCG